jgi:hypothetical protein
MHGAHPNMQMNQPDVNSREPALIDQSVSKSAVTFALPMYTVGIAVFFIYTCFKVGLKKLAYYELHRHLFSIGKNGMPMKLRLISDIQLVILIGIVTKANLNIRRLIVIMTKMMRMKIYMLVFSLFDRINF